MPLPSAWGGVSSRTLPHPSPDAAQRIGPHRLYLLVHSVAREGKRRVESGDTQSLAQQSRARARDTSWLQQRYAERLASADILIDGPRPWDLQLRDARLFRRCLLKGSLGLGEAFEDGWWDSTALDEFFARLVKARLDQTLPNLPRLLARGFASLRNGQTLARAKRVALEHYDLSNELYSAMLDPRMVYTCGYWHSARDLAEAQDAKLDLVCRKLGLAPGMEVLDIGCGWGSFAAFAASRYGAHVTGVTISSEQVSLARQRCAGLPVEIRLEDYRQTTGRFDRIVSLGMFEHVGHKNARNYMQLARERLADDGLFLLHTIGRNDEGPGIDPWVTRYIFPNSQIPSLARFCKAMDRLFVLEDLHNIGADYTPTLLAWRSNFERHWPSIGAVLGDRFRRRWHYYLSLFAGVFRARGLQVWQCVLAPTGVAGGYRRVS